MFIDRVPTRPNRYKVTPENGGAAYYIRLERADEPTTEGTSLNAAALNALLPKPATARVGQYLRVSAVDANGAITAVEAVDLNAIANASL